jgi:hypothetical protein
MLEFKNYQHENQSTKNKGNYRIFAELRNRLILFPSVCTPETGPSSADKEQPRVSVIIPRIIDTLATCLFSADDGGALGPQADGKSSDYVFR